MRYIFSLLLVSLMSTNAMAMCNDFNFHNLNSLHDAQMRKEEERKREEEKRRKEALNHLTDDEMERVLRNKGSDLRVSNAILTRYKDDFNHLRGCDSSREIGARHKAKRIFKSEIYNYSPNRDLKHLVRHLFSDLNNSSNDKNEKIGHLENKISILKESLIYLRDLSISKERTPFDVILKLHQIDVELDSLRNRCLIDHDQEDCHRHEKLLEDLRQNNIDSI